MDKYVIRKPGHSFPRGQPKPPEKEKKQTTIEELGGVVVIEDILRLKSKLQLENQTSSILVESLQELGKKIPCKKVMVSTKIGHVVNKMRKHDDPQVAKEAKRVYIKWRTYYKELRDRPQIEVKYDRKGEEMRATGRRMIAKALELEESGAILVEAIEREVVHACHKRLNNNYKRTLRSIVFALKKQDLKKDVLDGKCSVENLVKNYKK